MAEGPDPVEKGLEELGEEITCPICHGHFQDPKILPCLHYYCKECIQQLAARKRPFPCPECRQATLLPQNDPDRLPTPFFVNRMKELHGKMEKAHGKVEAACEMCSKSKAIAFCRQCTDFICSRCVESHETLKVFRGHKVVTLEELKQGGAKEIPLKEGPPMMCPEHEEQMKIFCFDCNRLICRDCIIYDHSDHKHEFVRKLAPQCKETLTESLTPLRKIQADIRAATKEVEAIEKEVSDQHTALSKTIDRSFEQLFEILKQRKQQLLKKASEMTQEKLGALTVQKKGFQLALVESQSLSEFVERSLENATDEELMSMHQQILTQVQEGCRKYEQVDLEPATVPNIAVEVPTDCIPVTLGKVYHLVVDPTKCTADGPGVKVAEINKQTHVTIHTRFTDGTYCIGKQRVEAGLKSHVDSSIIQATVVEKGRGVYEATYTPKIRGRHTLSIKVNGKEIGGSPFQVFVKIHPTQLGKLVRAISGVQNPWAITFNSKEELVVTEWGGKKVSVMDKHGKRLQTIQCDKLVNPSGVSLDKDGNFYVTDSKRDTLFKFNKEGECVQVLQKSGSQPGEFRVPGGVNYIDDKLFICDRRNHRIQVLDTNLKFIHSFGHEGTGNGQFTLPQNVVQDKAGNLYVTDHDNYRVQVFSCEGQFLSTFCEKGSPSKKLNNVVGICFDMCGDFVFVSEKQVGCISVFKPSGEFVTSFGDLNTPAGIAFDEDGFVYVCERSDANKISVF